MHRLHCPVFLHRPRAALLAAALAWLPLTHAAHAADAAPAAPAASAPRTAAASSAVAVATGPAGPVTASDIELMADEQVPPEVRPRFWSNADAITQLARSLYAQRALAAQAVAQGLGAAPPAEQKERLRQSRQLANLMLAKYGETARPTDEVAMAWARSEYRARPERFTTPEQVQARHILLSVAQDGSDDAAARARAEELLAQLRQGGDFAALARAHSGDPGSAARGGDLGLFERGKMVPAFDDAVFALKKPGDLAGPVKSPFGYHIIELTAREPARTQPFEDALPALREELATALEGKARSAEWERARAAAQIDEAAVQAMLRSTVLN